MEGVFEDDRRIIIRMKEYKLLVVGNIYDNHLIRFVSNLKELNPQVTIDFLSTESGKALNERIEKVVSNVYWFKEPLKGNKYSREFIKIWNIRSTLKKINTKEHYDIVNIHFPIEEYGFAARLFKQLGDTLLVTPWGSDVYRCGKRGRYLLRRVFNKCDYVSGAGNRFSKDVQQIFSLPDRKIVKLDIGSETIDYISENRSAISQLEARTQLDLKGDYFITCGYNAHKAQHHLEILDAINKIRNELPEELTLIFPVTYPKDEDYISELKKRSMEYSFHSVFFSDYLQVKDLFLMRQATDMFIHVQSTDANAQSVQEYLLLEKNVVNGEWLRYPELEKDGIPYYTAESIKTLSHSILDAYKHGPLSISDGTLRYIESYGWKPWIVKWNEFYESTIKNN